MLVFHIDIYIFLFASNTFIDITEDSYITGDVRDVRTVVKATASIFFLAHYVSPFCLFHSSFFMEGQHKV